MCIGKSNAWILQVRRKPKESILSICTFDVKFQLKAFRPQKQCILSRWGGSMSSLGENGLLTARTKGQRSRHWNTENNKSSSSDSNKKSTLITPSLTTAAESFLITSLQLPKMTTAPSFSWMRQRCQSAPRVWNASVRKQSSSVSHFYRGKHVQIRGFSPSSLVFSHYLQVT